ncbi:hypothetical protein [Nocardioides sp.]|uniref:hypothetical protein n=1 Tax=Nocardioides sp. TaxID=35761 RepID=UPI00286B3624|nr:hypothetical protein [Nocardioides sp.]
MSESENEPEIGIGDDQLPEDLQPGEDNPLAEGLDDDETVDDLLTGGKTAEESSDSSDGDESDGSQQD